MKVNRNIEEVIPIANYIIEKMTPFCERIEICGSIRRQKTTVGDIEIVCIPNKIKIPISIQYSLFESPKYKEKNNPGLMELIRNYRIIRGNLDFGKAICLELDCDIQVDVFTADELNYGYIKIIRTGSADYNRDFIFPALKENGFKVKDGYIYKEDHLIPAKTEEDVYRLIGREIDLPQNRNFKRY